MNYFIVSVVILLALATQAAAQCRSVQDANCVNWVRNGFCNSSAYTLTQRQYNCGISCGLCNAAGQSITAGVCSGDANANCVSWSRNGFCYSSAYSTAQKQAYCCRTCAGYF